MKRVYGILFTTILAAMLVTCTTPEKRSYNQETIYLTPGDSLQDFYVASTPLTKPTGLFVINYNNNLSEEGLEYATDAGLAVIFCTPSPDYLSTLISDTIIQHVDNIIADAVKRYDINPRSVIVGGGSAAGTLAIRYAQFCIEKKSNYGIEPAAVMAMDPPLDYKRFWYEMQHAIERNVHELAVQSGNYVNGYLTQQLGGSFEDKPDAYTSLSPFNYADPKGGRAELLKDMPIRLYIEPDVNWYIQNRGKDYLDMNAVDCAGMINRLRIMGNTKAELICTQNKGYNERGERDPHHWSIVDEKELIDWMIQQLKEKK